MTVAYITDADSSEGQRALSSGGSLDGERDREELCLSPVNIILGHVLERRKSKKEYFPFKPGKA